MTRKVVPISKGVPVKVEPKQDPTVIPAFHFECEGCQVDFAIKQGGRLYNLLDVVCPVCKTRDTLITYETSGIVLLDPAFLKAMFGE